MSGGRPACGRALRGEVQRWLCLRMQLQPPVEQSGARVVLSLWLLAPGGPRAVIEHAVAAASETWDRVPPPSS